MSVDISRKSIARADWILSWKAISKL